MNTHSQLPVHLGRLFLTETLLSLVRAGSVDLLTCLERHAARDWGDASDARKEMNDVAYQTGEIVVSRYHINTIPIIVLTNQAHALTKCMLLGEFLDDLHNV